MRTATEVKDVRWGRLARVAGRPAPLAAGLALLALSQLSVSFAQPTAPAAVHFQVVTTNAPGPLVAEVLMPPPPFPTWDAVTATSDSDCLSPLGVAPAEAGVAMSLALVVRGAGDGLATGETCSADVTLTFTAGAETHEALARAVFVRPGAPAHTGNEVTTGFVVSRVSLVPLSAGFGRLVELTVTNAAAEPLTVTGVVGAGILRSLGALIYVLPGAGPLASLDGLEEVTGETRLTLSSGQTARIGVVVGTTEPGQEGGSGRAWVASLQAGLLVELAGQEYSLRFPLLVTADGVELP